MLALTLTLLTAVFILGPDLTSRFILGRVVPRRTIQQTRSEEISRAIFTAIFPLCLAVFWVSWRHVVVWGAVKADVETYIAAILSQKFFDEHTAQFFPAAKTVIRILWALAWRLYLLLILYAETVNILILNYGELRNSKWMSKRPSWRKVLATVVLPRISQWHVLLRSISYRKSVDIRVDVITRRDALYRGAIEDLFWAPDGSLSGLLLTKPLRYQREKYLEDLKRWQGSKSGEEPHPDRYWKEIPGHAFLVMSAEIETINLRSYEAGADKELHDRLEKILKVRFTVNRVPSEGESGKP